MQLKFFKKKSKLLSCLTVVLSDIFILLYHHYLTVYWVREYILKKDLKLILYCRGSRKFAQWAALLKAIRGNRIILYMYRIMFKRCRKYLQRQRKQWKRRASNSCIIVVCFCVVEGSIASYTEETSSYEKSA